VFSQLPPPASVDIEFSFPQFVAKGTSDPIPGGKGTWLYWLPYESGGWLLLSHDADMELIGKHSVRFMTDKQATELLSAGQLSISLTHVDEVWMTLDACRRAKKMLSDLLEGKV
jgi:hypothetical protein